MPPATTKARFLPRRSEVGFTLTEMAIVLGIVGLIIGAIWAAASGVFSSNKVRAAQTQMAFILEAFRGLYSTKGVDANDDITCSVGTTNGFFPQDMIVGTCTQDTVATYPRNPWSGAVQVLAVQATQGISIFYGGLPRSACIQLATQAPNTSDVQSISLNGGAAITTFPIAVATANTQCANAGNTNSIQITFNGR
ncbi:MAG: type 4 pilus major pilin [Bdellovibrionales bacterium]